MPLRCAFFSEFHHITGPVLIHCVPQDLRLIEAFDHLHEYIIPKEQLCHRIIITQMKAVKILGFPVCIESNTYQRNKLLFNLAFAFDVDDDATPYEPVCRKIAQYLRELELECRFLSSSATRDRLPQILQELYEGLRDRGVASIPINEWCNIQVKLMPLLPDPPPVWDIHVPVFVCDISKENPLNWDLAMQTILPHIDGERYVAAIAHKANVDIRLARKCIQHLLYYRVIALVDLFQYDNVYVATRKLRDLRTDMELQRQCCEYVARSPDTMPSFAQVFALYGSIAPTQTYETLCAQQEAALKTIDERYTCRLDTTLRTVSKRLIQFGLVHGLLRRLRKHPVRTGAALSPVVAEDPKLTRMLSGRRCYDDIGLATGMCSYELDQLFEKEENIVTILR